LLAVSGFLKKNGISGEALGLKLSTRSLLNFLFGVIIAIVVLALAAFILFLFVPYHFEKGLLTFNGMLKEAHSYFWGNFLEELMFRGFPLIALSQLSGWRKAVLIMAIPFGLFHLPGIGFNMDGLKMILTTASYSFVFSYAFILTGSLWTAMGVHVTSNILLHAVTGLDGAGKAIFTPVFYADWPTGYDPALISFLLSTIIIASLLYLLIVKKAQQDLEPA
jgi:membrane protease YdiL (CAAX protease family)